jgi:TPR repeat protein
MMYQNGTGIPKDGVLAYKWFLLSLESGNEFARLYIDHLKTTLTPELLADAERMARDWQEAFERTD